MGASFLVLVAAGLWLCRGKFGHATRRLPPALLPLAWSLLSRVANICCLPRRVLLAATANGEACRRALLYRELSPKQATSAAVARSPLQRKMRQRAGDMGREGLLLLSRRRLRAQPQYDVQPALLHPFSPSPEH